LIVDDQEETILTVLRDYLGVVLTLLGEIFPSKQLKAQSYKFDDVF
jgi:hypothetical protein